jgi:hypothetical protein
MRDQLGGVATNRLEVTRARLEEAIASRPLRPAVGLARVRPRRATVQRNVPTDRSFRRGQDLLLDALERALDRHMHRVFAPELHMEHVRTVENRVLD